MPVYFEPGEVQRSDGPSSLNYSDNNDSLYRQSTLARSYYELHTADEDTWFRDDLLYKDHLHEVLSKWNNIDDGIWGKVICLERNRRIAKAYARAASLTVNASDADFDGYSLGLAGFDNPYRDELTDSVLASLGNGLTIKIDADGSIWAKRHSRCAMYVPEWRRSLRDAASSSIGPELESYSGRLPKSKSCKLFDMERFRENVTNEMFSTYPNITSLQLQCVSTIAFGSDCSNVLDSPCSILIINIVALDMLRSRLRPTPQPPLSSSTLTSLTSTSNSSEEKISKPKLQENFSSPKSGFIRSSVRKLGKRLDNLIISFFWVANKGQERRLMTKTSFVADTL